MKGAKEIKQRNCLCRIALGVGIFLVVTGCNVVLEEEERAMEEVKSTDLRKNEIEGIALGTIILDIENSGGFEATQIIAIMRNNEIMISIGMTS
ncbi:hypothetical protein [Bacillus sp. JCM 19041]|uniref:hypothetical protein n=1 Tax=Bacillus sp. JCM 19041 TaxID=1460637 RepID=UPI00336AC57E